MLIFTPFATMLTAGQNEASQIAGVREVKEEENSSARRIFWRGKRAKFIQNYFSLVEGQIFLNDFEESILFNTFLTVFIGPTPNHA